MNLQALAANYVQMRERSAGECAGVVKANGYGLGIAPVVRALAGVDCRVFCVATLSEALELRQLWAEGLLAELGGHLAEPRVLLLGGLTSADAAAAAAAASIEPVLNNLEQTALWYPFREQPATLQIDTGMERLGFLPEDLAAVDWSGYQLAMVMTHLACADDPEHPMNAIQLQRFAAARQLLPRALGQLPTSIANSAGCLLPERWHGDLSRPGIGLYGGHPQNRIPGNPMQAVVHLHGQVVQRRQIPANTAVGYGASFVTQRQTEVAVVGLGYADGLPRMLSNTGQVSIQGTRAPIIGRVSMDVVHVDVTDVPKPPGVGEWVEFLGADIGVDEVAQWAGTIGLEVLCGLGRRPTWEYQSTS